MSETALILVVKLSRDWTGFFFSERIREFKLEGKGVMPTESSSMDKPVANSIDPYV